jgi:hypothetical protein
MEPTTPNQQHYLTLNHQHLVELPMSKKRSRSPVCASKFPTSTATSLQPSTITEYDNILDHQPSKHFTLNHLHEVLGETIQVDMMRFAAMCAIPLSKSPSGILKQKQKRRRISTTAAVEDFLRSPNASWNNLVLRSEVLDHETLTTAAEMLGLSSRTDGVLPNEPNENWSVKEMLPGISQYQPKPMLF